MRTEAASDSNSKAPPFIPHGELAHPAPIFCEPLCLLEMLALHLAPEYYGSHIPRGDGSAVVIIPGLLGIDLIMFEMHAWLGRIGYRPYYSGIGFAAACPDKLSRELDATIERAHRETKRRVHLVGYSLGGIFARSAAVRKPERVASVITLGTPFRGLRMHRLILGISAGIRGWIQTSDAQVADECATSRCDCAFGRSLGQRWPESVRQTALYTKCDGIVDWRYCVTGKPEADVEVVGTHLGLPYNATVFSHIAARLATSRRQ
jgi:triacylglycerol lipase